MIIFNHAVNVYVVTTSSSTLVHSRKIYNLHFIVCENIEQYGLK